MNLAWRVFLPLQGSLWPWDSLTGFVCSIPPSGSSGNVLCEPEISENHRKIGMEVLGLFPGPGELMNHTWRGFEGLLSGLFLKISQDLALSKQPSPELSCSYTHVHH